MTVQPRDDGAVRILVAEDSPTQAAQLQALLEPCGYAVTVAADGRMALAAARRQRPSLIISDIVMPGLDGYGLCREIKDDPTLADVPVVLVTSLADAHDVVRGLECGADNFICKPYESAYLLSRIRYILANVEQRRNHRMRSGIEIRLGDRKHFITAERQQILDLLISTYEQAVHLNEELRRREKAQADSNQVLRTLFGIAESLNHAVSERQVADAALDRILQLPGVAAGWIQALDGEGRLCTVSTRHLPPGLNNPAALESNCACRSAVLHDNVALVMDLPDCPVVAAMGKGHVCVPLQIDGRTIGILNLVGPERGLFDDGAAAMLRSIGNQVAAALDRARLYEHMERLVDDRTGALRQSNARLEAEIERRRLTEAELQQTGLMLDGLIRAAPVGIAALDNDGRITVWNEAAAQITGWSETEAVGRPLPFIDKADPGEFAAVRARLAAGERLRGVEIRRQRRDGSTLDLRLFAGALANSDNATRAVAVFEDITQRKELEQQLFQAQKMEAVGHLTGGLAHDFNNLLGIVIGNIDMILEQAPASDPVARFAQAAVDACLRGADLTRQLLAFSRRQPLEPKQVKVNDLIKAIAELLRRTLGESIEIELTLAIDAWDIKADPVQLESALVNIANNARDAMPGGGRLVIATRNAVLEPAYADAHLDVEAGEYVVVEVTDSGCGIPADILSQIFLPFFTTKKEGHGTGLGLSMVYGFMKQSAGHLKVYSELGHGTTVRMYLPRIDQPAEAAAAASVGAPARGRNQRVLIVEDNPGIREVAARQIGDLGYLVTAIEDGPAALALLDSGLKVDLLFTDVVMPGGMNGFALAEEMRRRRPGLRVLFTSGFPDAAMKPAKSRDESSPGRLLTKPVRKVDLAKALAEAFGPQDEAG